MTNDKGSQALKTVAVIAGTIAASGAAGLALAYAVEQWQEYQVFEQPLSADDLRSFGDVEGTVKHPGHLSARVSRGGVAPEIRCRVWPILLGVPFAAAPSASDRSIAAKATQDHYESLQRKAEELLRAEKARHQEAHPPEPSADGGGEGPPSAPPPAPPPDTPRTASFAEASRIIGVDIPRTPLPPRLSGPARPEAEAAITRMLQAFAVEEPEIGYCQGMSEVAAVFLNEFSRAGDGSDGSGSSGSGSLALNEAECYATMAHFLFRFRRNFLVNNEGILGQLRALGEFVKAADPHVHEAVVAGGGGDFVFALRPFALLLMRELGTAKAAEYWDHLIAASDGPRFHIAMVAAALLQRRWAIIHAGSLDRLLLVVNNLAVGRPDAPRLQRLLIDARRLMDRVARQ